MYYRLADQKHLHPGGAVTKYNLEIAGPAEHCPEIFVLSESPNNEGPPARSLDLAIGEVIAQATGKPLTSVSLFVEQGEKYLLRTFREFQSGTAAKPETIIQQNPDDQSGALFSRQEVDRYIERAEIPFADRMNPCRSQSVELSQHEFNSANRPAPVPPEPETSVEPER
jgi:hypothetical protein